MLGADHERSTCVLWGVHEPTVGAPGAVGVANVMGADATEAREVPPEFVAVAVNV